ncbi:MAG: hypothetical protein ABI462_04605 [Ignavibacteria bacterium]
MKNNYFLIGMMTTLILSSCSNKLSTDEANSLLLKLPNEIVTGKIGITVNTGRNYWKQALVNEYQTEFDRNVQNGILKNIKMQQFKTSGGDMFDYVYQITSELSDTVSALVLSGNRHAEWKQNFSVKCGELKFNKVVGIFQEAKSKTAEIEYDLTFIPTIFGNDNYIDSKFRGDKPLSRKIIAKLYDNGWKLEK